MSLLMTLQMRLARLWFLVLACLSHAAAWVVRKTTSVRPPMAGEQHINTVWLTRVLHQARLLADASQVTAAVVSDLDANRGFASVVKRVQVTVDHGAAPPMHLILKRSYPTITDRMNVLVGCWWREARFLSSDLARDPSVADRVRLIIHASGSALIAEYSLLMHDATKPPFSASGVNMVMGNQIWGHDGKQGSDDEILATVERCWLACAQFQGKFFNDAALLRRQWLRGAPWYTGSGQLRWHLSLETTKHAWRTHALAKFSAPQTTLRMDPRLRDLIERSIAASTWDRFQAQIRAAPFTLCHGDFHAANMLTGDGGKTLLFVDWSEVGVCEPAADLGQTIISDVPAALHARLRPLLQAYHRELLVRAAASSGNHKDYSYQQFEADFGRATMARWVFLFVLMTAFPVPEKLLQYFHDQLMSFGEQYADLRAGTYPLNAMVSILRF